MEEIWKNIDNRYSVSNLGRVKSNYGNKERILKPFKNERGYLMVDIRRAGYRKSIGVHRLVALAFIENDDPQNKFEVNHKDEDKTNNCVDNLEWCTTLYNCNYGTRNERRIAKTKKPICSVDQNGFITYYSSRNEAAMKVGVDASAISKSLKGTYENITAGGYLWFYDDGNVEKMVRENNVHAVLNTRKIYSVDACGNIEYFSSISDAHRKTGINNISRALKNRRVAGNKSWFYV